MREVAQPVVPLQFSFGECRCECDHVGTRRASGSKSSRGILENDRLNRREAKAGRGLDIPLGIGLACGHVLCGDQDIRHGQAGEAQPSFRQGPVSRSHHGPPSVRKRSEERRCAGNGGQSFSGLSGGFGQGSRLGRGVNAGGGANILTVSIARRPGDASRTASGSTPCRADQRRQSPAMTDVESTRVPSMSKRSACVGSFVPATICIRPSGSSRTMLSHHAGPAKGRARSYKHPPRRAGAGVPLRQTTDQHTKCNTWAWLNGRFSRRASDKSSEVAAHDKSVGSASSYRLPFPCWLPRPPRARSSPPAPSTSPNKVRSRRSVPA